MAPAASGVVPYSARDRGSTASPLLPSESGGPSRPRRRRGAGCAGGGAGGRGADPLAVEAEEEQGEVARLVVLVLGRERLELVRLERMDEVRRHHHQQLRLALLVPRGAEEHAENGQRAEERDLVDLRPDLLREQPRDGEALAVAEPDGGLALSRGEPGDLHAADHHRERRVDVAHLGGEAHVDGRPRDHGGRELEDDPELLPLDLGGPERGGERDGELAACEELRLLAGEGDQGRLGEDLGEAVALEDAEDSAQREVSEPGEEVVERPALGRREGRVRDVGRLDPRDRQTARPGPGDRRVLRRVEEVARVGVRADRASDPFRLLVEEVDAELAQALARDLREPDLELDLLLAGDLHEVRDLGAVQARHLGDPLRHPDVGHAAGEHHQVAGGADPDLLAGEEVLELLAQPVEGTRHAKRDDERVVLAVPQREIGAADALRGEQHLGRCDDLQVRHARVGHRDPADRLGEHEEPVLPGFERHLPHRPDLAIDAERDGRRDLSGRLRRLVGGGLGSRRAREREREPRQGDPHLPAPFPVPLKSRFSYRSPRRISTTSCCTGAGSAAGGLGTCAERCDARSCGFTGAGAGAGGGGRAGPGASRAIPVSRTGGAIPGVETTSTSMRLRSARRMLPFVAARASFSLWGQSTMSVATVAGSALSRPLERSATSFPTASTRIPCRMIFETGGTPEASEGFIVTITSTRSPGWTNPATPTTSSTRTASARIPAGRRAARPLPAVLEASRGSRIGSPLRRVVSATRPASCRGSDDAPSGRLAVGQSTTASASSRRGMARGMSLAATTTFVVGTRTAAVRASRYRVKKTAVAPAAITARTRNSAARMPARRPPRSAARLSRACPAIAVAISSPSRYRRMTAVACADAGRIAVSTVKPVIDPVGYETLTWIWGPDVTLTGAEAATSPAAAR